MRRKAWVTLIALVFCLATAIFSRAYIGNIVHHARHMRTEAIEHMDRGEIQAAKETLAQLAQYLKDRQDFLEVLCSHDDLHEIKEQLIDAQAGIDFGSGEDFYQAIYRFGERLEHISDVEMLRFSNFY